MGLKNVIEHSIAASGSEVTRDFRKSQVLHIEPALKRLIIQSIDVAVFALPSGMFTFDQAAMRRQGYDMVGSGVEAQVFSDGAQVMKYVRRSERMSATARNELLDRKEADFAQLHGHMSAFVLDQTISIAPHVAKAGKEVVQTVQPYVAYDPLVEWYDERGNFHVDESNGQLLDGLSDFVDASWGLFGETGVLPDTAGPDNMVVVDGRVILLDTQSLSIASPESQILVQRQLGAITALLDRIS